MNRRRRDTGVPTTILLTFAAVLSLGSCGPQPSFTPIVEECICLDSTLRFNCTTVDQGITVWTVTVVPMECQLSLQHNQFADLIRVGGSRFCPGMSIVATPLSVVDTCYNSQLTIRNISADLNGRTVVCQHDTTGITDIGNYIIMLTTDPFPPPNTVSLSAITNGLTFSWESVAPDCSSLTYEIEASSDCGTCPTITDSTSVTCLGIQLGGDTRMCNISVRAITCGNITGDYSEPLTTTLQAANAPTVTSIIPVYSQNTSYLISFQTNIGEVTPVSISGNDVTVQSIQITDACGSNITTPCDNDMCSGEINVMISPGCTLDATSVVTVDVAATSVLGMGPATTLRIDGSSRNFVQVTPNVENSTIICDFTNQLDDSNISCIVTYGQCGQLSKMAQGSSTPEEPNSIRVELDLPSADQATTYCYTVTASNDTFTVLIEGNFTIGRDSMETTASPPLVGRSNAGAIAGAVVAIVIVLLVAGAIGIFLVVLFIYLLPKRRKIDSISKETHNGESIKDTEAQQEADETVEMTANEAYAPTTQQSPTKKTVTFSSSTPAKEDESSLLPAAVSSPQDGQMKEDLFKKHQNEVPVAIERDESEDTLKEISKKFWMQQDWKMSRVEKMTRKLLGLSSEQPLYLTVGNKTEVERNSTLGEIYETNKSEDNHLHIAYSSQKIADPNES